MLVLVVYLLKLLQFIPQVCDLLRAIAPVPEVLLGRRLMVGDLTL